MQAKQVQPPSPQAIPAPLPAVVAGTLLSYALLLFSLFLVGFFLFALFLNPFLPR